MPTDDQFTAVARHMADAIDRALQIPAAAAAGPPDAPTPDLRAAWAAHLFREECLAARRRLMGVKYFEADDERPGGT